VTRRADVLLIAMAGLAGVISCPAAASAATQCQSTAVTAVGGLTEDQAETAWSNQVKQSLGAAWSNIKLAKDEKVYDQNLGLGTLYTVTAYPCRTVLLVNSAILQRPVVIQQRR
jgi:hypothetical protein